jgi:deoxycytidylate deaminase
MFGTEIIFGIVGAAGTALPEICDSLKKALEKVSYHAHPIRLSHELHGLEPYADLSKILDQQEAINAYMDAGNELRQKTRSDVMALLGIAAIRVYRRDNGGGLPEEAEDQPLPRTAYILNSLKRKEEVALLQEVYGKSFILISVFASRDKREIALAARIAKSRNVTADACRSGAEALINRDEFETGVLLGQNVRDTFPHGDVFLDADDMSAVDGALERAVSIVFGHPFETPTRAEVGMQFARSAALRSADLSRQVGYAACTNDGQILAVGANEVAKPHGGFYWADTKNDQRDFQFAEREQNTEMKSDILRDLLQKLKEKYLLETVDLSPAGVEAIAKELKGSTFMDITEYGRAVHAEMAVVTDAARRGVSLAGATMYGTTFPCHNCAKSIVAAGVREVVYIEPYPKSQVARLFHDSIATERDGGGKVRFSPFVGIAPHRFSEFFEMTDRKDDNGLVKKWDEMRSAARPRIPSDPASYVPLEHDKVKKDLRIALAGANIQFAAGGEEGGI